MYEDKRQKYLLLVKFNRRTRTHNPSLYASITRSWARPARGAVLGVVSADCGSVVTVHIERKHNLGCVCLLTIGGQI